MLQMDWSLYGVIAGMVGAARLVWAILRAWAREPLKDAKIAELKDLVEILNDGMEKAEANHARERAGWERSQASFCGPPPNHETSITTRTSSEHSTS